MEGNGKPTVDGNIALAIEITKRNVTLRRGESLLDTFEYSDALLGLMKACETFDPNRRTQDGRPIEFSTYAWTVISREISNGRKVRGRQNRLQPIVLGELQGRDRQDVFEIPDDHKPPLPLHLLERFFTTAGCNKSQTRCKQILYDYYVDEMTYEELGKKHKVTRERIRQLLNKGLELVRTQFAKEIEAAQDV